MTRTFSTLIGFAAILTWSFLALLSTASGPVPPFQLAAMTFFLGGMVGAGSWLFRPQAIRSLRQPWPVWALGVAGLCIYHCAYFFAIQSAPPVEASLIAYLWPLLIVVFAAFLPGERLRAHHFVGVLLGLAGAVIVITRGGSVGLADGIRTGHVIALFCAFVWSGYSVLSRRFGAVPTDVVAGYCLITAAVACNSIAALPALIGVRRMDWNSRAGNSTKYTRRSAPAKNSREKFNLWRSAQPSATSMKSGKTSSATDMSMKCFSSAPAGDRLAMRS